jgi:hypothetical protein
MRTASAKLKSFKISVHSPRRRFEDKQAVEESSQCHPARPVLSSNHAS